MIRVVQFVLLFFIQSCISSPQLPDYFIYKKDTLLVYNLLLEKYLDQNKASNDGELFGLKFRDGGSPNCWRGYQAIYEMSNDSLFLRNIIFCGEIFPIDKKKSIEKMKYLFKEKVKNNKVFLDWFSGDFSLPIGQLLRWDGVFHRTFEKEIQFKIKEGKIKKISEINNYVDSPKRTNRRYHDTISNIIFKELEKTKWKNDISEEFIFTINKNGKIKNVRLAFYTDENEIKGILNFNEYKKGINQILKSLKGLKFDIIKKDNKAIEEEVYLSIWMDKVGDELENWTR